MWLLVTYVLIASASPAERTVPLCACQLPTRLRVREHLEHYQQTFLQTAAHLTSPTPLFSVASISSSYRTISNETMSELLHQPASRINTTQLADSLGGLDLARRTVDFGETNTEEQINDTSNDLVEDECPTGFDTLDCEDCGGPEQSWETNRHNCHCIGIEAENYRWRDCYCLNWDDPSRPCTFDSDSEVDSLQHDTESDDGSRHGFNSNNDTRHDSNQDNDLRYDSACEADD